MEVLSLTLTVLRKSPHPSLCPFTHFINPRWSEHSFVSVWQKYNQAHTWTHTCTQSKANPRKETLDICYYKTLTTHTHPLHLSHKQEAHLRSVAFPCPSGLSFPISWCGEGADPLPISGKSTMILFCQPRERRGIDLFKVSVSSAASQQELICNQGPVSA